MSKKTFKNYLGRNFKKRKRTDKLSKNRRSRLMSKIHSKDTRFEKEFISVLKKFTRKKFKTNVVTMKGKPDIVFSKSRLCVFLDSDFWHGWQYPRWRHLLKNNFWRKKIENNRIRDRKTTLFLRRKGWVVLRFWEHAVHKNPRLVIRIVEKNLL